MLARGPVIQVPKSGTSIHAWHFTNRIAIDVCTPYDMKPKNCRQNFRSCFIDRERRAKCGDVRALGLEGVTRAARTVPAAVPRWKRLAADFALPRGQL
jgi:hypothetical protein